MFPEITERLTSLLDRHDAVFELQQHEATRTSQDSARARGEPLGIGGKALLLKTDDTFRLFVLPADRRLDSKALKARLSVKKLRFATPEELLELTGLVSGAVPPFGAPLLPFELFVDEALTRNERIAFNAGALTVSVTMPVRDYLRIARPITFRFSLP